MAEDVTTLVLNVESKKVEKATKDLGKMSTAAGKSEKASKAMGIAFNVAAAGALAIAAGAALGARKLIAITREFDILNAQLITATGSIEGAEQAFGAIQRFATDTPYALGEVTESFVQLVNRGLDPSEKAMTNIGNFASAFGRNILDATRAIGQATTGEFESLKQFGIVSKKIGDEVEFTFRGVKQTVGFNAREIQGYMDELSENNFAGAMETRMDSLDGAMSNLGDAWDKLWLKFSKSGSGDLAQQTVLLMIDGIEKLEGILEDSKIVDVFGTLAAILKYTKEEAAKVDFAGMADGISAMGTAFTRFGPAADGWRETALDGMIESYREATAELNKAELNDAITTLSSLIINQEAVLKPLLADLGEDPGNDGLGQRVTEAADKLNVMREMLVGVNEQLTALDNTAAVAPTDALAEFNVGADGDEDPVTNTMRTSYEKVREGLLSEEEAYAESYEKRKQIILDSTFIAEKDRGALLDKLDKEKAAKQSARDREKWATALKSFDNFQDNMEILARSGNEELNTVYKAGAIAQATMSAYNNANSAFGALAGIPIVGPALGTAAAAAAIAAGMANVSAIANTSAGSYAGGGQIPDGKYGLVGEAGPELVRGPATVSSAADTARKMGSDQKGVVVNFIGVSNEDVTVEETENDDDRIITIAVDRAVSTINNNIRTGSGDTERALSTRDRRTS